MDFFKSAVAVAIAKSASLPYAIGDRVDNNESIWALHNSTKREDNSPCSAFVFDISANRSRLPLAKNASRKLRTLRHPGVIKVLDVIENETHIYVVTERLVPLAWNVKRKSLSEETIRWGLFSLSTTLKFINNEASSVHGNIRVSSIYTSESGEWKVGGFEILSSMNEEDAMIYTYGSLLPDSGRYAPPEVAANGWSAIKKQPLAAADAYGLGVLIYEAFNGSYTSGDQLTQPRAVPANMVQSYRRLVNPNPKLRLTAAHFVEQGKKAGGFFETPLIHITEGADSLGLMTPEDREDFLKEVDGLPDDVPEDFFKMKILPELLKSVEFGGGGPVVLQAIIKIGQKLSDDEFESRMLPVVNRLYASPDRQIRVCLLDNLPQMVDRIPQKDVNNKIWPALLTGFTDVAPVVREQTVKAVIPIITKLSNRTVNGELLRYLAKTANDPEPGIRTNTTICLGKIARSLDTSSRTKVLTAAFTRSLRDPFVHSRNAALLALNATIDCFTEEDCATKIMPVLCGVLVDREKMVRDQASKTMDSYMQRVKKFATTMPDTVHPQTNGNTSNAPAARIGNPGDTSWAGWAISSFTNKLGAAKGEMQTPVANGTTSQAPSAPASGRATPILTTTSSRTVAPAKPRTSTSTQETAPEPDFSWTEEADNNFDAWGTMDDEGDSFFDASSTKKDPPAAPSVGATPYDEGEPDFAGWLANQSKSRSKQSLPKGLSKTASGGTLPGRPTTERSNSASVVASRAIKPPTTSSKLPVKPAASSKPKEPEPGEDDWGAAWD